MRKIGLLLLVLFLPVRSVFAQTDVLTQHNDNSRTGLNPSETILTPSNVNSSGFGKLFSVTVGGYVYAQPLYKSSLVISGTSHNVVFVATEGDSVYAFDADTGATLWHASVIDSVHGATSGETTGNIQNDLSSSCTDLIPQIGITATPVIDPNSGTMYVEAASRLSSGVYVHRLHTLDIRTGAEKSPGPIEIAPTFQNGSGTTLTFDPLRQMSRPGLLLTNGNVYVAYGAHCDSTPYYGWLVAYNASTLARAAVFVTTPDLAQGQGGIWQSGAGLAADSSGNIFLATGNGSFNGATDFGDSYLKLLLSGSTISLLDYFTPYNQGSLDASDLDPGSGGVLLLPDQPGNFPHELVQAGKDGTVYVINRDQMTANNEHYCSSCTSNDPQIVQEIQNACAAFTGDFGMPAYWNNLVYFGCSYQGLSDVLRTFSLSNGQLAPSSTSSNSFGYPGATPSISANGTTNGILWAIDSSQYGTPGPAVLHAYDATNLGRELWNSTMSCPHDCDNRAGNAVKFAVPTIANGKVYVGTQSELDVYGLVP